MGASFPPPDCMTAWRSRTRTRPSPCPTAPRRGESSSRGALFDEAVTLHVRESEVRASAATLRHRLHALLAALGAAPLRWQVPAINERSETSVVGFKKRSKVIYFATTHTATRADTRC